MIIHLSYLGCYLAGVGSLAVALLVFLGLISLVGIIFGVKHDGQ